MCWSKTILAITSQSSPHVRQFSESSVPSCWCAFLHHSQKLVWLYFQCKQSPGQSTEVGVTKIHLPLGVWSCRTEWVLGIFSESLFSLESWVKAGGNSCGICIPYPIHGASRPQGWYPIWSSGSKTQSFEWHHGLPSGETASYNDSGHSLPSK